MSKRKYRGKYTNARDCRHAKIGGTENLMQMVEVLETCPRYGILRHNLVTVHYCQYKCDSYERR